MGELKVIRKIDMKKLLVAVAMTAFMINSAHAASPRSESAVSGDVVTVGDVFDGVTHDADYALAPAPAYGKTLTLGVHDLRRISDAFNLGWQASDGFAQTVIRRAGRSIGSGAIEAALQGKLAEALPGRKFEMQLHDRSLALHLPEGAGADIAVSSLKYDLARGEFHAQVAAGAGESALRRAVSGRIFPVTSVPVLLNPLHQGDVISERDIDYIDVRTGDLGANVIADAQKLVGMSPRRGLQPLKPLTASDIVPPVVVKKGDIVTMTLQSASLSLTVQGKALESGAAGETVRVLNTASGQAVEAVVTGPRAAAVRAPAQPDI